MKAFLPGGKPAGDVGKRDEPLPLSTDLDAPRGERGQVQADSILIAKEVLYRVSIAR
jgi:hypothetical protein